MSAIYRMMGIGIALMLFAAPLRAEVPYWRVTADRVTVVTNGSARRCVQLATQFMAFEKVLQSLANLDPGYEPLPVAIYAITVSDAQKYFYSEEDIRKFEQQNTNVYSKTLPGNDFNILAIVDEGDIEEPWQSVLLLHAQGILAYGPARRYPMWYQLGVSNVLNGLSMERDNSVLLNREQLFEPTDDRDTSKRVKYDLASLLQATGRSFENGGDIREFVSRARDWAQFGLLTTPERRKNFFELAKLMKQGTPADEAVNDAFGTSLAELSSEFDNRRWRKEIKYRLPAPEQLPAVGTPMRVEPAELKSLFEVLSSRARRGHAPPL